MLSDQELDAITTAAATGQIQLAQIVMLMKEYRHMRQRFKDAAQFDKGWDRLEAFVKDDQIVLLGCPIDHDDPYHPDAHNCDAMGCSSVDHVVYRGKLTENVSAKLWRATDL